MSPSTFLERLCTLVPRPGKIVIESNRLRPLLDAYGYRKDPLPIAKPRAPPQTDLDFGP